MLLLDSRLVGEKRNVRLGGGRVQKHGANPLMVEDKPWEPRYDNLYANILYGPTQKLYRCWYNPTIVDPMKSATPPDRRAATQYSTEGGEVGICYAFSGDGLQWTKPELGLVEFEGSKANNLVLRGTCGAGVVEDPRDPLAERRYKMFYGGLWTSDAHYRQEMAVRFSAHGLQWCEPIACPEIMQENSADTHSNVVWAPELAKWVGITRLHSGTLFHRHPLGQRTVGRTESPDFLHWTKAVEVLQGEPDNQTYSMQIFRYGDVYLGLLMIIRLGEDRVHCELAWSPDALTWERIDPGTPLIANSSTRGDYDWGCVFAASNPIVLEDEIRIYYGGSNGLHGGWREGSLCLATLRSDGWAGYEPIDPDLAGTIVTTPVACRSGLSLTANATGGSVQVTIIDDAGNVLASGHPIQEDVTDREVAFAEADPLARLVGRPVRLKFELHRANLFSFSFSV